MGFSTTVEVKGIRFEVEGTWTNGDQGDRETPPSGGEIEFDSIIAYVPKEYESDEEVSVDGHTILDFGGHWSELEEKVWEYIEKYCSEPDPDEDRD